MDKAKIKQLIDELQADIQCRLDKERITGITVKTYFGAGMRLSENDVIGIPQHIINEFGVCDNESSENGKYKYEVLLSLTVKTDNNTSITEKTYCVYWWHNSDKVYGKGNDLLDAKTQFLHNARKIKTRSDKLSDQIWD